MTVRTPIPDFQLANPLYKNASVSFYTVAAGVKTATLATLYSSPVPTSTTQLANPQKLNSYGQFKQPVYIAAQVIGVVSGISIPGHDTGVISPAPSFRVNSSTLHLEYSYDDGVTWNDTGGIIQSPAQLLSSQTSAAGIGNIAHTAFDVLFTYSMPANTLSANGMRVRTRGYGKTSSTTNNKEAVLTFAGTAWCDMAWASPNSNNRFFLLDMDIVRISATAISVCIFQEGNGISLPQSSPVGTASTFTVPDLSANATAITFEGASGTSGAASDVKGYAMTVELWRQPP